MEPVPIAKTFFSRAGKFGGRIPPEPITDGLRIIPANAPQQQPTIGFGGGKVVAGVASCVAFFYGYYLP